MNLLSLVAVGVLVALALPFVWRAFRHGGRRGDSAVTPASRIADRSFAPVVSDGRGGRPGFFRTAGITLGVGLAAGVLTIFLIPGFTRLGVPARAANDLPLVTFGAGLAWGFAATRARGPKTALRYVGAALLLGAVGWFLGLLAGGLAAAFGLSDAAADWVPLVGFALGLTVGALPGLAAAYDALTSRNK